MNFAVKLSLVAVINATTFQSNCYKLSDLFGDPIQQKDVVKSDLDKIKSLINPTSYFVSEIITC